MGAIPKKVRQRISDGIKRYQPILKSALERDINESDTVTVITDLLSDTFGYDKYTEVSSEHRIRGTYCDLALEVDGRMLLLVEVKAVGIELKDNHTKQAIDYGSNKGCEWVALTNGIKWKIYRIKFSKPIDKELVLEFDFLNLNNRNESDLNHLFLLSKEGRGKSALKEYHSNRQATSKYLLGAVITSDAVLSVIRRELKRVSPEVKVANSDIEKVIISEVIKRDVVEGERANEASKKVSRALNKTKKKNDRKEVPTKNEELTEFTRGADSPLRA